MTRWLAIVLGAAVCAGSASAQDTATARRQRPTPTVTVTLSQALDQAQRRNPTYLQAQNNAVAARWAVRNAYTARMLPSLSVGGGMSYTGPGSATFGGSTFIQSSPSLSSGYNVSLNWAVSGQTWTAPGQQKAEQRAVDEDIGAAHVQLRYDIAFQYFSTLQAVAQTDVAHQQLDRNQDFLSLAQAQFEVGQKTVLDVKQAQSQRGAAEIGVLRAEQAEKEAKLELFRRMGIEVPANLDEIALTDSFPVAAPAWQLNELLAIATENNPQLRALRSREVSSKYAVKAQRSRFLPSLSFSADWNAFTQQFTNEGLLLSRQLGSSLGSLNNCEFQNSIISSLPGGGINGVPGNGVVDCRDLVGLDATGSALRQEIIDQIRQQNDNFPFGFTRQPFRASIQVSLPIFDSFSRNLSVAQARAQRDDLVESIRGRELALRTEVQGRLLALETSHRAIPVQLANRDLAREQLQLARDRYRLGSGSTLEVSDAQNVLQQAERDYVNAIYDYHKAVAALELAVGRPLR